MLKAAIALMLIATVVSLFSGLFFLVKDEGNSNRLVTALTVRVVLALTGAEALYADMGHFGRKPIARAWFILVLPALGRRP